MALSTSGPAALSSAPVEALDLTDRGPDSTRTELVVLGAGGHGREIADIIRSVEVVDRRIHLLGVVDDADPDRAELERAGIDFLGPPAALTRGALIIGVGSPSVRRHLATQYSTAQLALRHPTSMIGSDTSLAPGAILAQGVIVTTNVSIGHHTHVNIGCSISHDCTVGDYVTLSPGARLTGAVSVGSGTFIGAAATVLPCVTIGADATIGAGAVVTADVADGQTVAGVPARPI